jgi:uncharacterized protein
VTNAPEVLIRDAQKEDLDGIVEVNRLSQYNEKANGLVQQREKEEFQKLLRISKRFIVAKHNGKIVGYLILLDETALYKNEFFSFYQKKYKNFVFVDQVATHPAHRRKGVARAMYGAFLPLEKKRILLDILIKPRNPESIAFHASLGFKPTGDCIHLKSGMCAEVYEKIK